MKTNFLLKLIPMLAIMLGSLFLVTNANAAGTSPAVITNHSGVTCKNYNDHDVTFIDYLTNGTRSSKTSATQIICGLTRNTSNSNGAYVYVDLSHSVSGTTTCTAYSYEYTGALRAASAPVTWTGVGFKEILLNLVGASKSSAWSDYSVLCTIPGNFVGTIRGVDLYEQ